MRTRARPLHGVAALVLAACGVAACQGGDGADPTAPAALAGSVAATHAGLRATLAVAPGAVPAGASFAVRYTIANVARDTARLVFGGAGPLEVVGLRGETQATLPGQRALLIVR